MSAPCPIPLEALVAYWARELDAGDEDVVEEHLFTCEACTAALELVADLAGGIRALVAGGRLGAAVSDETLDRLRAAGRQIRSYRIEPGGSVDCTAAPDDDFVIVRLAGIAPDAGEVELSVDVAVVGTDERTTESRSGMLFDPRLGELIMLFPAAQVRTIPRSVWSWRVPGVGDYVMRHTPWDELDESART